MRKRLLALAASLAVSLQALLLAIAAAASPALPAPATASRSTGGGPATAWVEQLIWQVTVVDSPGTVGAHTSLALDATGNPHISYYDASNGDLKYASFAATGGNCGPANSWDCQTLDSAGDVGLYSSIAVDGAGHLHISYYDASNGDLKYAFFDGTSWQIKPIDSAGDVGRYTSLALDSSGRPHISYYDASDGDLRCIYFDGSSWIGAVVDSAGDVGQHTSLALDDMDRPHISYYDGTVTNGDLKYAHFVGSGGNCGGAAWQCDFLDTAGLAGLYTSLALSADGRPGISYFGVNSLKYARYVGSGGNCGPGNNTWRCDTIQGVGNKGGHTSVALDGADRPRISFYEGLAKDLHYAQYVGSGGNCGPGNNTWQCDHVDSAGDVGQYTSLALDGLGRPRISYYDVSSGDLKYAANDCTPVLTADVSGPSLVFVGQSATYTATYTPPTATLPVAIAWDNGTVGPIAVYSWTSPDTYTVAVTATNPCGGAQGALAVTVCQPLTGAEISGPGSLAPGQPATYTAIYSPPTATLPLTITWDNGATGPSAYYHGWPDPGVYTVAVTVNNPCSQVSANRPITVAYPCYPPVEAQIAGPIYLNPGETGLYTATYSPPTATLPVTITWDNGTVSATAAYSWTAPGSHAITVTVGNRCRLVSATLDVLVATSCDPLTGLAVHGPAALLTGEAGVYTATYSPPTATLPVLFVWDNGTVSTTAAYSWTVPGAFAIVVTATNPCQEEVTATLPVTVTCSPVSDAEFVWTPVTPMVGQPVTFTGTATSLAPLYYTWNLGTVTATGRVVVHAYGTSGPQPVTMSASNGCAVDTATHAVSVQRAPRPIYLSLVIRDWNRCYLASGSFWELEDNDSIGEANGPLCSGQAYVARPDDRDDFFSFPGRPGRITADMWNYAPGIHGQMLLYSSTGWYAYDNNPWDGWQIITDTLVESTFWIRLYTDENFTTTLPYSVSATFPER